MAVAVPEESKYIDDNNNDDYDEVDMQSAQGMLLSASYLFMSHVDAATKTLLLSRKRKMDQALESELVSVKAELAASRANEAKVLKQYQSLIERLVSFTDAEVSSSPAAVHSVAHFKKRKSRGGRKRAKHDQDTSL